MDRTTVDHDLHSVSEIVAATEIDLMSSPGLRKKYCLNKSTFPKAHLLKRGCPKLLKMAHRETEPQLSTISAFKSPFESRRASFNFTEQKDLTRDTSK